ncbi:hypothetical protein GQ42DRAFT_125303 [Ramicandelaber brevisporus]|nr:hypothetical protein GQ42DRAFT_125303 [Ramicandelaber brevisporus]
MNIPVKDMIFVPLAELTPNRKGFHTEVIVLEVSKQPQIDKSKGLLIFQFIVADRTGSMVLAVWEPSGPLIREGDILRIVQAETKLYNNALQLGVTRTGRIVRIGRYTLQFAELPNHSLYQWKEAGGAGAGHQRQHPHQQQMTQPQYPR